MRHVGIFLCGAILTTGFFGMGACSHIQLQTNTNDLNKTLPHLLEDEITSNFFILHDEKQALPAFDLITSGTAQITDQFGGQIGSGFPAAGNPTVSPQISGQRQSNVAWTLSPITDPNTLSHVRDVYLYVMNGDTDASTRIDKWNVSQPALDDKSKPVPRYKLNAAKTGWDEDTNSLIDPSIIDRGQLDNCRGFVAFGKSTILSNEGSANVHPIAVSDMIIKSCHGEQLYIDKNRFVTFKLIVLKVLTNTGSGAAAGGSKPKLQFNIENHGAIPSL